MPHHTIGDALYLAAQALWDVGGWAVVVWAFKSGVRVVIRERGVR